MLWLCVLVLLIGRLIGSPRYYDSLLSMVQAMFARILAAACLALAVCAAANTASDGNSDHTVQPRTAAFHLGGADL